MARAQYFVSPNAGTWKVTLDGKDTPGFPTQAAAIRAAVDAAHTSGKNGHNAQVIVKRPDGTFRTEWTYGNDPYPPKG